MAGRLDEELIFQMDEDIMEPEAPASPDSSSSSDEEIDKLIFQMDKDSMEPKFVPGSPSCSYSPRRWTKYFTLKKFLSNVTVAEKEVYEKVLKYEGQVGSEKNRSSVKKRLMMRLRKDGYNASMYTSSWVATHEHPGGEYEYIVIVMEENGGSTRLIVDIDFRSQFEETSSSTPYTLQLLTDTLPHIFVGKEEKLKKIISFLRSAARKAFMDIQYKWFPCWEEDRTIT